VSYEGGELLVGSAAIMLALIGWRASCAIPDAPSEGGDVPISLNPIADAVRNIRLARNNMTVFYCIMGISWFWLFGGSFLTQVPNFAVAVLQGHATLISVLLGAFIVGVAIGSLLCAKISGPQVEPGLIPFGAIGLTLFSADLFFASTSYQLANAAISAVMPLQFFSLSGGLRIFVDLMAIGMFGGMFIVPLYAMVQSRTESHKRARVIAANNVFNALFMVSGALMGIVCLSIVQMSIPQFFALMSGANLLFLMLLVWRVPEFKLRFLAWITNNR